MYFYVRYITASNASLTYDDLHMRIYFSSQYFTKYIKYFNSNNCTDAKLCEVRWLLFLTTKYYYVQLPSINKLWLIFVIFRASSFGSVSTNNINNVSEILESLIEGYDIRLRPKFGGKCQPITIRMQFQNYAVS